MLKKIVFVMVLLLGKVCAAETFDSKYGVYSEMVKDPVSGAFKGMEIILPPSAPKNKLVFSYADGGPPSEPLSFDISIDNIYFTHPQFGRVKAVLNGSYLSLDFLDSGYRKTIRKGYVK